MELTKDQIGLDFQTPPDVAGYMARLVPDWVKTVLEPTPGRGNIVRALHKRGFDVTAPEDFFLLPGGGQMGLYCCKSSVFFQVCNS